ncbi:hypothetical protein ACFO4O_17600 [Glaciecola siphonariae]|uniref:Transposase n=1 Tax=Glaciecola siphonariae TaxID=521012 RepID=A0ABV9M0Q3_9ALTE
MAKTPVEKLLEKHPQLIHNEDMKVASHVQREEGDWWVNTVMLEGYDVPFKYKRKKRYKSLQGALVNITFYPSEEEIAGLSFEFMKIVRLKRS